MKRLGKILISIAAIAGGGTLAVWLGSEAAVMVQSRGRLFDVVTDVPVRDAGLVLGTSKYVAGTGRENLHYRRRIDAAAELYHAGRVGRLIVSGNGLDPHYNEPRMMRKDLVALGVPDDRILSDESGLRTLDSMIRAGVNFGVRDPVVVSQKGHNARAVFLGRMHGMNPVAFNAGEVPFRVDPKTAVRERLARVLAVLDVTILKNRKSPDRGTVLAMPAESR